MDNINPTSADSVENSIKIFYYPDKPENVQFFSKVNSYVSKGGRIGEYSRNNLKIPIKSTEYAKILKIDQEEHYILLEKCKHETKYHNLCVDCSFNFKEVQKDVLPDQQAQNLSRSNYVSISSDLTFSEAVAKKEEQSLVSKYLQNKKLILLLDIDNTILHTSSVPISEEEYEDLKKKYDWEVTHIYLYHPELRKKEKLVIKFRPYLKQFLQNIKDKYDIYIYTYGTKSYAIEIIKYLNTTFGETYFNIDKLVARENNMLDFKSIKRVFPSTDDMVVIVDDRTDVWVEDQRNLINVSGYYYFKDERMFKIEHKYAQTEFDHSLYLVMRMLLFVNEAFYVYFEKFKEKINIKHILEEKIHSIFLNKKFVLSGVFSKNIELEQTRQNILIEFLGGSLESEYSDEVDIVLTRKYASKKKLLI
jgi:FCP1-like phosphatase family protein